MKEYILNFIKYQLLKQEELMDNVTLGGVATYLERAEEANVNLFI